MMHFPLEHDVLTAAWAPPRHGAEVLDVRGEPGRLLPRGPVGALVDHAELALEPAELMHERSPLPEPRRPR
eukprot:4388241-Pyramimonas_sp.AAC.1